MVDEFLWRKQILPFDTIPWGGRELSFTAAYLGDMAEAFAAGALDVVPFMAEDPRWGPVNDPERCQGFVRAVEVVSDGLDALVAVDAATDALLAADPDGPRFATGVRLVEHYRTSGSREFPVVLSMVYTTCAPALTGLRPWKRED